mgnify:CR=1 FL=1
MKTHLLLSLMSLMLLCRCEGNGPANPVAQTTDYTHSENITTDQVWTADALHIIESEIYIQQAVVVIEPGAQIQFRGGAGISVMQSAGLVADGTNAAISFTREDEDPSNWKSIYFAPNARRDSCILINCTFENGGADANWPATIYCRQTGVTVVNCEIRQSESNGIYFAGDCNQMIFEENIITENADAPVVTAACNIPHIGPGSYTGNGSDFIEIVEGAIHSDAIWPILEIPYFVNTDLDVRSAQLSLPANIILTFASRKSLSLSEKSQLYTDGENGQIIFTGFEERNGYWDGIYFSGQSNGTLKNCVIQYGGGNPDLPANVYLDLAYPAIEGCIIKNSGNYGVYINGVFNAATFTDNKITQNSGAPISTGASNIRFLEGNEFIGNSLDFIEIRGGEGNGVIKSQTTLKHYGLPYLIKDRLIIRSATLLIDEGVRIKMDTGSQIDIMEGGGLIADGRVNMIEIIGRYEYPGSWNCIYFSEFSNHDNCYLNYCQIQYGGGDSRRPANIYLNGSGATITNCTISSSLHYGLYLNGNSLPILENNHFANNLNGPVFP